MSIKVIDEKCFESQEEYQRVCALAASIKQRHALIAQETERIDTEKKEIRKISEDIFYGDLDGKKPELYGNHDYHVPDDIVRVNFKVSRKEMDQINKKSAKEFLKERFGDEYDKIFEEVELFELDASEEQLLDHAGSHPELFRIALRDDLGLEALKTLVIDHPEFITLQVKNLNEYAEAYPAHVSKKTKVKVQTGFIDKVSKLPNDVLVKTKKIIKALLDNSLSASVICGNTKKK